MLGLWNWLQVVSVLVSAEALDREWEAVDVCPEQNPISNQITICDTQNCLPEITKTARVVMMSCFSPESAFVETSTADLEAAALSREVFLCASIGLSSRIEMPTLAGGPFKPFFGVSGSSLNPHQVLS
jgi:hypothetical protein